MMDNNQINNENQENRGQQNPYARPDTNGPVYTEQWMNANPYGYTAYQNVPRQNNGMIGFSIAGMTCGILSIICCFLHIFDLAIAIPGLVFSIIAIVKKYEGRGMAIAGIICSAIGLLFSIIYFLYIVIVAFSVLSVMAAM